MSEKLYTIAETGELLKISRSSIYALIRGGMLRTTIVGQRKRVLGSSIQKLIERGLETVDPQE